MVAPTNPNIPDLPEPFEQEKEPVEPELPTEIVSENLPILESEKELEDFDFTLIDSPSDTETATTELATEALQLATPEIIEGEEEVDLTNAQFEEAEEMEEEAAEAEDIEDEEEEDLNLITKAISDDYADPNGQGFKKLLEEILPFDDDLHILPKEQLDLATHFFDLENKVFYTHEHQLNDLTPLKNVFLSLDLTDEEIRSIKITHVPSAEWEAFIHIIKYHN